MFREPEPIKYDNTVDIHRFGIPKTETEILFESLVHADDRTRERGWCTVKKCVGELWEDTPLCRDHAFDMWQKVEVTKNLEDSHDKYRREREAAEKRHAQLMQDRDHINKMREEALKDHWQRQAEEEERIRKSKTRPGTIYYLQVGALIKIGFSGYLEGRLRSYPPDSKVLATHPGTPEVEQRIHNKFFNHLAHGREWFNPSPEIDQHIAEVHKQYPQTDKI
jgi:hypothetical protein